MPRCIECGTEMDASQTACPGCGATVGEELDTGNEPVVVLHASSPNEAMVAEATLEAEGIPAFVVSSNTVLPHFGSVGGELADLDVMVPADLAEAAADILDDPPPSDEEMNAAVDAAAPVDGV